MMKRKHGCLKILTLLMMVRIGMEKSGGILSYIRILYYVGQEQYVSGRARIALFDGNLEIKSDGVKNYEVDGRRCAHVFLDYSWKLEELTCQVGQTLKCGKMDDQVFYLVTSNLPGDVECMQRFAKYFAERGARIEVNYNGKSIDNYLPAELYA